MMTKPLFNSFLSMPTIPYNIISHLSQDVKAEGFWKLLKYQTYDALTKPNLTLQEKMALVWKNDSKQNDYSVFFTRLVEDEELAERTIFKIYKAESNPKNAQIATLAYEMDVLCGGKMAMVDFNGFPCNRVDVMEHLILQSLNGADVNGVGWLQFNGQLSRLCRSATGVGNNTSFFGTGILMAVQIGDLNDSGC